MKLSSYIPTYYSYFFYDDPLSKRFCQLYEIYDWVKRTKSDAPTAGTILTNDDTEVLNKWIPPGMIEEFKFPELKLVIQKTKSRKAALVLYLSNQKMGLHGKY